MSETSTFIEPNSRSPLVSIGMPVYNGAASLAAVIESLQQQTFTDFELIVADNHSTDDTPVICQSFADQDRRIRFIRHPANLGAMENFNFVLHAAVGKYFMWAAADDVRSPDFIAVNVEFLERSPDYVASMSPAHFDKPGHTKHTMGDWSLENSEPGDRILQFFDSWHANAKFYSVIRRHILTACPYLRDCYVASDWTIVLYLAQRGKLKCVAEGWIKLGTKGGSSKDIYAAYRRSWIDWLLPMRHFGKRALKMLGYRNMLHTMRLVGILTKLNCEAFVAQIYWRCFGR